MSTQPIEMVELSRAGAFRILIRVSALPAPHAMGTPRARAEKISGNAVSAGGGGAKRLCSNGDINVT